VRRVLGLEVPTGYYRLATGSGTPPRPEPAVAPPDMVIVEGGAFKMGDTSGDGQPDEKPAHAVTVSSFSISKYEVTFDQYEAFCAEMGRRRPWDANWGRGRRPVINVSWYDAAEYCNWLSREQGLSPFYTIGVRTVEMNWSADGYRLPTEAEWEYAARGGRKTKGTRYAGGAAPDTVAWYSASSANKTQPVGGKQPNELGLYDMSGNVREWCNDWYDPKYYAASPGSDPRGPDANPDRVVRGGSWVNRSEDIRVYSRDEWMAESGDSVGFRPARPARQGASAASSVTASPRTYEPSLWFFGDLQKSLGDAPFSLTPPTSNSQGAFTYESRNTAVATIRGNTVTVVGSGTTTLTAYQAASGNYAAGTATATLTVTRKAAGGVPGTPNGFVLVEGGAFLMGDTLGDGQPDEKPTRTVTVASFSLSKYEVTFDQYDEFCAEMGRTRPQGSGTGRGTLPVIVSWWDAAAYCNWLSLREGLRPFYAGTDLDMANPPTMDWSANGYRLPTEAEWEYAARGGKLGRESRYAGSASPDAVAWYDKDSGNSPHPVGGKQPNELGLYDMSGNLPEWCNDWYGAYSAEAQTDPRGPAGPESWRVVRGGSYADPSAKLRTSSRGASTAGIPFVGFRPARPVSPSRG
jgi:formylglycine-generating enzyme required for sulfatase activity